MTIQVDITKKDLIQKLQMCDALDVCLSIADDVKPKYREKLFDISKQIDSSGNYQDIYNDLHHIEKMLLE